MEKLWIKWKPLNLSNSVPKKTKSDLKFVYSENSTLSIIFLKNEDLLGVVGEVNNNIKESNNITEKDLKEGILEYWKMILEIVSDNLKRIYNIFIGWVLTPIIFGSFAPALPFFLVMGVLYAILN